MQSTAPESGTTFERRIEYGYNRDGGLKTLKYPSGREVVYTPDRMGRPLSAEWVRPPSAAVAYANGVQYALHGPLTQATLAGGVSETWAFNSRLQPASVTLGGAASGSLQWYYCPNLAVACSTNNGNVRTQLIAPLGARQDYAYDAWNRLETFSEAGLGTQEYLYDRWGNRALKSGGYVPNGITPTAASEAELPNVFWLGSNRLRNPAQAPEDCASSLAYVDCSGNVVRYGSDLAGARRLIYDAENRLTEVREANNTTVVARYVYDGEGRRVKKVAGGQETIFGYDAEGRLAWDHVVAGTVDGADCRPCAISVDHLGSTRVMTDANGAVVKRTDYLPFGDEIARTAAGYTYAGQPARQMFTGKERDAETSLDYFIARYYSAAQGRFTTPDEFTGGAVDPFTGEQVQQPGPLPYADIRYPQSLNKYAYVMNNPLRWTDPDGHCAEVLTCTVEFAGGGGLIGGPPGAVIGGIMGAAPWSISGRRPSSATWTTSRQRGMLRPQQTPIQGPEQRNCARNGRSYTVSLGPSIRPLESQSRLTTTSREPTGVPTLRPISRLELLANTGNAIRIVAISAAGVSEQRKLTKSLNSRRPQSRGRP